MKVAFLWGEKHLIRKYGGRLYMGNIWDIVAGLISSALAAMGVGGGGLLVIYLTEFLKMDQRLAQGINLVFFLCASATALAVHTRTRKLAYKTALLFGAGGAAGAIVGSLFAHKASSNTLRFCFGILLIFASVSVIWKELLRPVLTKLRSRKSDL